MAFFSKSKNFLKAAAAGDMDALEKYLARYIPESFSIDVTNAEGASALILAASNGRLPALKALIAAKADLEIADENADTALIAAIKADQPAAARLLIAAGANIEAHDDQYVASLLLASDKGQLDVVQDLVAAKAALDTVSRATGRTGLHWAVENGHGPVVEALLTAGARTDIADRKGETPLDIARKKNAPRILQLLEAAKAPAPAATEEPVSGFEDTWLLMGKARIAQVCSLPATGLRLTDIFNFENRERVLVTENLKTGAQSTGPIEKFETLAPDTLQRAEEKLKSLGGEAAAKKTFNL